MMVIPIAVDLSSLRIECFFFHHWAGWPRGRGFDIRVLIADRYSQAGIRL